MSEIISYLAVLGVGTAVGTTMYVTFSQYNDDARDAIESRLDLAKMKASELLDTSHISCDDRNPDAKKLYFMIHNYSPDVSLAKSDFEAFVIDATGNISQGDVSEMIFEPIGGMGDMLVASSSGTIQYPLDDCYDTLILRTPAEEIITIVSDPSNIRSCPDGTNLQDGKCVALQACTPDLKSCQDSQCNNRCENTPLSVCHDGDCIKSCKSICMYNRDGVCDGNFCKENEICAGAGMCKSCPNNQVKQGNVCGCPNSLPQLYNDVCYAGISCTGNKIQKGNVCGCPDSHPYEYDGTCYDDICSPTVNLCQEINPNNPKLCRDKCLSNNIAGDSCNGAGRCVCPVGQSIQNGRCITTYTPPSRCSPDTNRCQEVHPSNSKFCRDKCLSNNITGDSCNGAGRCVCPVGQTIQNGTCTKPSSPPPPPPKCTPSANLCQEVNPTNSKLCRDSCLHNNIIGDSCNGAGSCVCPVGQTIQNGTCTKPSSPPPPPPKCTPSANLCQEVNPTNSKLCRDGCLWNGVAGDSCNGAGNCVCPVGQTIQNKRCTTLAPLPTCNANNCEVLKSGSCTTTCAGEETCNGSGACVLSCGTHEIISGNRCTTCPATQTANNSHTACVNVSCTGGGHQSFSPHGENIVRNHQCVHCGYSTHKVGNSCPIIGCGFGWKPWHHVCLECASDEVSVGIACVKLICKDNQYPLNHYCRQCPEGQIYNGVECTV